MIKFVNTTKFQQIQVSLIGQLHDDVILLQLPESLSLLFSCANQGYSSLIFRGIDKFKKQSKTEMNSGSCSQIPSSCNCPILESKILNQTTSECISGRAFNHVLGNKNRPIDLFSSMFTSNQFRDAKNIHYQKLLTISKISRAGSVWA